MSAHRRISRIVATAAAAVAFAGVQAGCGEEDVKQGAKDAEQGAKEAGREAADEGGEIKKDVEKEIKD